MNGNQTFCEDIDEVGSSKFGILDFIAEKVKRIVLMLEKKHLKCALYNPCDGMVKCINLAPGFRCEPCPNGFDGVHVTGYYAQSMSEDYTNQLCTGKI